MQKPSIPRQGKLVIADGLAARAHIDVIEFGEISELAIAHPEVKAIKREIIFFPSIPILLKQHSGRYRLLTNHRHMDLQLYRMKRCGRLLCLVVDELDNDDCVIRDIALYLKHIHSVHQAASNDEFLHSIYANQELNEMATRMFSQNGKNLPPATIQFLCGAGAPSQVTIRRKKGELKTLTGAGLAAVVEKSMSDTRQSTRNAKIRHLPSRSKGRKCEEKQAVVSVTQDSKLDAPRQEDDSPTDQMSFL